jgi:hypothetical protein
LMNDFLCCHEVLSLHLFCFVVRRLWLPTHPLTRAGHAESGA